jgi:HSP20 family molecular chaperone IbpA
MNPFEGRFNPLQIDWEGFQNQLKSENFIQAPKKTIFSNNDFSWLENYIHDMVSESLPRPSKETNSRSKTKSTIFETHDYIIVKVNLADNIEPEHVKIYHYANQLKLEGLSNGSHTMVQLPAQGRYHGSKAIIRNGILEIRIPKETNETYRQIRVRFDKN